MKFFMCLILGLVVSCADTQDDCTLHENDSGIDLCPGVEQATDGGVTKTEIVINKSTQALAGAGQTGTDFWGGYTPYVGTRGATYTVRLTNTNAMLDNLKRTTRVAWHVAANYYIPWNNQTPVQPAWGTASAFPPYIEVTMCMGTACYRLYSSDDFAYVWNAMTYWKYGKPIVDLKFRDVTPQGVPWNPLQSAWNVVTVDYVTLN